MKLRIWPRNAVPLWFAWSCLMLQLRTLREEYTVYIPDDATDTEVTEIAAEQRALAARNTSNSEPAGTILLRELRLRLGTDS
jgi:hypothetical protein